MAAVSTSTKSETHKGEDLIAPGFHPLLSGFRQVTLPSTLEEQRAIQTGLKGFWSYTDDARDGTEVSNVEVTGGQSSVLVTPKVAKGRRAILYVHGGGLYLGNVHLEEPVYRTVAHRLGATVLAAGYRLLPEATLQELIEDLVAAYDHLLSLGFSAKEIVVFGVSGGAAGSLYLLLELHKRSNRLPLAGALLSPACGALHYTEDSLPMASWPSMINDIDPLCSAARYTWPANEISTKEGVKGTATDLLQVSRFVGLPPLYISAGSAESYFSQQQHLAFVAAKAGVDVTFRAFAGNIHAAELLNFAATKAPEAVAAYEAFVAWVDDRFATAAAQSKSLLSFSSDQN